MTPEQPRYDLIGDFGVWLYRIGRITEEQHRRAAVEWERRFRMERPAFTIEILLEQGALSETSLKEALQSVRLLDSLPQDLRHLGTVSSPIDGLIGIILRTAADAPASNLQFKTTDERLNVRYQVEGVWYDMESLPGHLGADLADRLRELSASGRLLVRVDGNPVDLVIDPESTDLTFRVERTAE